MNNDVSRPQHTPRNASTAKTGGKSFNGGASDRSRLRPSRQPGGEKKTTPQNARQDHIPRRNENLAPLYEIDEDILNLVIRRARLLARLPENNSREKELRTRWEEKAAKVSRDPRLIRQMFALLQEVDIAPGDLETGAFNLAPSSAPIAANLKLPGSDRQTRLISALAAGAGAPLEIQNALISTALVEGIKIFNQMGASLRWEEFPSPYVRSSEAGGIAGLSKGGQLRPMLDKVIHAGSDALNLYLALFLATTRPSRLKIMGESSLRFLDLTAVRHFLPVIGSRMSNVVPGQDGLPARLEASAILPKKVEVPANLPDDAVTAFLISLLFWDAPVSVNLAGHPHASALIDEAMKLFAVCGCGIVRSGASLSFMPAKLRFPEKLDPDMELSLAFTLLAIPGLCGGNTCLTGRWPEADPLAAPAASLLEQIVTLSIGPDATRSAPLDNAIPISFKDLPPQLIGPALAFFVRRAAQNPDAELPLLPQGTDMSLADEFLLKLGFTRNRRKLLPTQDGGKTPWAAPDLWWGIGFALGSFFRRNIQLSNPAVIHSALPPFWTLFNSLPAPTLERTVQQETDEPARPARRRVLSSRFLSADELPPVIDTEEK